MITTLLLIAIAAALNAAMDMLENENYHSSIFAKWDQTFWYKRESWKTAKKIFGYKIDGWHLTKSAMIVTLALAIAAHARVAPALLEILVIGVVWNLSFNAAYHLMKKR
jgi:hypothetical protein